VVSSFMENLVKSCEVSAASAGVFAARRASRPATDNVASCRSTGGSTVERRYLAVPEDAEGDLISRPARPEGTGHA
jgi:hypothetical protein